jgi:hypothetical protein
MILLMLVVMLARGALLVALGGTAMLVMLISAAMFVYISWWSTERFLTLVINSLSFASRRTGRVVEFSINVPYRLRWSLLHAWNVILLRYWLVISVLSAVVLVTLACCLILRPVYSATSVIRIERDLTDIN